ncbi:MAG: hypothetical protein UE295_02010 [Acutalibacteraceae bacterium]|nr:hypothetical protein [Acutalibacteraceae bacterium]
MVYLYIVAFFLIGIYLIITGIKDYRILLVPGVYFLFLGAWWLADVLLTEVNLLGGIYSWIIRAISAVILLVTGIIYYFKYYKPNKDENINK